jgi:Fe-S cluster biogenesis protein NfuA
MADAPPRLDDPAVRERLTALDELLERVEQIPGPAGELALEAVSALAEVYGEALARALALAAEPAGFVADELLGHLLVLHGIHPDPVERRVERALDEMAPAVRERGGEVALAGLDDGVARVRLTVSGCGAGVEDEVRTAVLAVAPELREVRRETPPPAPAFVPLGSLMQRPAGVGP